VKQLFCKVNQLFFRNVFLVACYGLVLLVLNGLACYRFIKVFPDDPLFFLHSSLEVSLLVFLFFLVFSFEFYAVLGRSHLRELHQASWRGLLRFQACQSLILLGSLLLLVLSLFCWETAMYFRCQLHSASYYLHVLKVYLLNFVLPGLAACMIGYLLAEKCKRLKAYLVIFLLALLGLSPVTEMTTSMASEFLPDQVGVPICRFLDLLALCPRGLNFEPDYGYGIPMEPYRWQIAFFALFLLAALILLLQWKRLRAVLKGAGILLLAASVACMGASFARGSVVMRDYRPDGEAMFDQSYYAQHPGKVQAADFRVAEYQMQLRLRDRLEAEVVMALETPAPRRQYSFTLHHSLKIRAVEDAQTGGALQYERDGDYLDIYPSDPAQVPRIRIVYQGASPIFYTNAQGVRLPGTYAYYPMEGYHKIYDGSYHATIAADKRRFDVSVDSSLSLICNLPAVAENHFAGESEGLTLVAGFYQEYNRDGILIWDFLSNPNACRGYDPMELAAFDRLLKEYSQLLGADFHCSLRDKPMINMGFYFNKDTIFSDHILLANGIDAGSLAISAVNRTIPVNAVKTPLRELLLLGLEYGADEIRSILKIGFEMDETDLAKRIVRQFDALGEDAVYRAMYQYLIDETDQRTPEEMVDSLS